MRVRLPGPLAGIVLGYFRATERTPRAMAEAGEWEACTSVPDGDVNECLLSASMYGQLAIVESMVSRGTNDLKLDLDSALGEACGGGRLRVAEFLIAHNAEGWETGLVSACFTGHPRLAQLMIAHGAHEWAAALAWACRGGYPRLIKLVVMHAIAHDVTHCPYCFKPTGEHLEHELDEIHSTLLIYGKDSISPTGMSITQAEDRGYRRPRRVSKIDARSGHWIYKITNDNDGLVYIGSTIGRLERRFFGHIRDVNGGSTTKLHSHMRAIGIEHFSICGIEEHGPITRNELRAKEDEQIVIHDSMKNGLNGRREIGGYRPCAHFMRIDQCGKCSGCQHERLRWQCRQCNSCLNCGSINTAAHRRTARHIARAARGALAHQQNRRTPSASDQALDDAVITASVWIPSLTWRHVCRHLRSMYRLRRLSSRRAVRVHSCDRKHHLYAIIVLRASQPSKASDLSICRRLASRPPITHVLTPPMHVKIVEWVAIPVSTDGGYPIIYISGPRPDAVSGILASAD